MFKGAIACSELAIANNPGILTLWAVKGYTIRKIYRYEEAIRYFDPP
jgi:hypothetical protein